MEHIATTDPYSLSLVLSLPSLNFIKLKQVHKDTEQRLQRVTAKYKEAADKTRRLVEFEVGDFVYAILTKDRYIAHEYNKLAARKVGPVEIIEKISPNAYRLKLPSSVRTADVFNVKHLIPFRGQGIVLMTKQIRGQISF